MDLMDQVPSGIRVRLTPVGGANSKPHHTLVRTWGKLTLHDGLVTVVPLRSSRSGRGKNLGTCFKDRFIASRENVPACILLQLLTLDCREDSQT